MMFEEQLSPVQINICSPLTRQFWSIEHANSTDPLSSVLRRVLLPGNSKLEFDCIRRTPERPITCVVTEKPVQRISRAHSPAHFTVNNSPDTLKFF